jgi:hypothetical protein
MNGMYTGKDIGYIVMPDGCCISIKCTSKAEPTGMKIKSLLHLKYSYFVEHMIKNEIKFSFFEHPVFYF